VNNEARLSNNPTVRALVLFKPESTPFLGDVVEFLKQRQTGASDGDRAVITPLLETVKVMAYAAWDNMSVPSEVEYVETGRMSASLFRAIYPLNAVPSRTIRARMRRHYLLNRYYIGVFSIASRDGARVFAVLRAVKGLMSERDPEQASGLRGYLFRRVLATTPIYTSGTRWLDTGNFLHMSDNENDVIGVARYLSGARVGDDREILYDKHGVRPEFGDLYKNVDHDLFLAEQRTLNEASAVGAFLQSRGCKSVLDLGCGDGRITRALTEQGMDVVGVDIDGKAIGRALMNCHEGARPSFLVWPLETIDLALPGATFSAAIIMYAALPWSRESELISCLVRIRRCLCPGGLLILDTVSPTRRRDVDRVSVLSDRFALTSIGVRTAVRTRRWYSADNIERTRFEIETTTGRQRHYTVSRLVLPRHRLAETLRSAGFFVLRSVSDDLKAVARQYRRQLLVAQSQHERSISRYPGIKQR
jgi:SAM-dependent methyltransferase